MLNSKNNAGLWLVILLCSAVSGTAASKVYSWKDKNGDTHYSQFPRKMVEKNVAQSRATRKQAEKKAAAKEVVKQQVHLLNGLDDIVETASELKEPEKQLSRKTAEKFVSKPSHTRTAPSQYRNVPASQPVSTTVIAKKKIHNNAFLTGIQKKLKRQKAAANKYKTPEFSTQVPQPVMSAAPVAINRAVEIQTKPKRRHSKHQNEFLTAINKKRFPSNRKAKLAEKAKLRDKESLVKASDK